MTVVPVIDLGDDDGAIGAAIDRACREIGFFQIVGHGLDAAVEDSAWTASAEFFALPLDEKLATAIPPGDAYGYGPFMVERLAASLGDETPADLKETFSVGPPWEAGELSGDAAAAFVFSPNRWPAAMPGLEPALRGYYDSLAALAARVMSFMAAGLGLDRGHFVSFIDEHTSALRALRYPDLAGVNAEPGQLRAGAHSDYGTLTLLRQNDAPGGLQVRDASGAWHDVPAVEGAYVVNVGDALQRWTNDRWRSTVHRVVLPPADLERDGARQSIAFFHNANWDAVIECLPSCRIDGEPPRYAPITAGDHLRRKFLSTQS